MKGIRDISDHPEIILELNLRHAGIGSMPSTPSALMPLRLNDSAVHKNRHEIGDTDFQVRTGGDDKCQRGVARSWFLFAQRELGLAFRQRSLAFLQWHFEQRQRHLEDLGLRLPILQRPLAILQRPLAILQRPLALHEQRLQPCRMALEQRQRAFAMRELQLQKRKTTLVDGQTPPAERKTRLQAVEARLPEVVRTVLCAVFPSPKPLPHRGLCGPRLCGALYYETNTLGLLRDRSLHRPSLHLGLHEPKSNVRRRA